MMSKRLTRGKLIHKLYIDDSRFEKFYNHCSYVGKILPTMKLK